MKETEILLDKETMIVISVQTEKRLTLSQLGRAWKKGMNILGEDVLFHARTRGVISKKAYTAMCRQIKGREEYDWNNQGPVIFIEGEPDCTTSLEMVLWFSVLRFLPGFRGWAYWGSSSEPTPSFYLKEE